MIIGLPLDAALDRLHACGIEPTVVFTAAPRRTREMAAFEGGMPREYIARVIGSTPGRIICAWFYEPRP